jgi:glycosyltransferase involved in cell wall biosynthesis
VAVSGGQVLIISHDVVGERMAGPGIRYFHLAQVLSREFAVTLMVPNHPDANCADGFSVESYTTGTDERLEERIAQASVVVAPAIHVASIPALRRTGAAIVVDGYDPYVAETLSSQGSISAVQTALTQAYLLGDFFLCASERQRDWWLGLLEATGRINAYTFGEDPSLRRLVAVVPFGLPGEPPRAARPVIKGVWPGVERTSKVLLWGGGLWPWLDPLTAIRAVARVWRQRQDVRLIFPGTRHPNPGMAHIATRYEEARRLADGLGLLGKAVFFGEWVPYADWPGVLLESDLALSLHMDTLETRLAFRSRVLDYIWAGLPIVTTHGDATSELVEKYRLGVIVGYEDEAEVAEAIRTLLETPREVWRERCQAARRDLTWERAARPLVEFCRTPRRAPDKVALGDRLGNPYYLSEVARLRSLVERYERGRFIRLMRRLHRLKERLW